MRPALVGALLLSLTPALSAAPCEQFTGPSVDGALVTKALNGGRCVKIDDAVVVNPVEPTDAADLTAHDTTFTGIVDLSGNFGTVQCVRCTFEKGISAYLATGKDLDFSDCTIQGDANFHSIEVPRLRLNGTRLEGDVVFAAATINDLNLADVKFGGAVDFSGARIGELKAPRVRSQQPILIAWQQFGPAMLKASLLWATAVGGRQEQQRLAQVETALRFWQRNAAALHHERDVTAINYEIVSLRRRFFMQRYGLEWWASLIAGLPTRYGTRPYRPLWIALFCVTAFALVYMRRGAFVATTNERTLSMKPRFLFALAYSLDTFLPFVEITGTRKWGWGLADHLRWVETSERIIGLVVASLAAYGLASFFL